MSDIEEMLSVAETKVDTERALARLRARVDAERIAPVRRGASADHLHRPQQRGQLRRLRDTDVDGAAKAV